MLICEPLWVTNGGAFGLGDVRFRQPANFFNSLLSAVSFPVSDEKLRSSKLAGKRHRNLGDGVVARTAGEPDDRIGLGVRRRGEDDGDREGDRPPGGLAPVLRHSQLPAARCLQLGDRSRHLLDMPSSRTGIRARHERRRRRQAASRWPAGPRRRRGTRRWCEMMSSRQSRSRLRQAVSGRRQPVGSEPPRHAAIGERKSQDHRPNRRGSQASGPASTPRTRARCVLPDVDA